jgi:hypothetical protein
MAISESQLSTWSNYQQTQSAINTHESIRLAITDSKSLITQRGLRVGKDYEIYLQGSYRNSTNIRSDSDVDVVVQLKNSFSSNAFSLSIEEKTLFNSYFSSASYSYREFRLDIQKSLELYYGSISVNPNNKCIKLTKGSNRLHADIIPCLQYRHYNSFRDYSTEYIEGIILWTQIDNRQIINYPKLHYKGSVNKHQSTRERYKSIVRIFKQARNKAVENGFISEGVSSSYFLECLLYNIPNILFSSSLQDSYKDITYHILTNINSSYICQNEMVYLFGNAQDQWSISNATALANGLNKLWEDW